MIIEQLKTLLKMLLLAALQILVLNHMHIQGYALPLVYVTVLLYLPLSTSRVNSLLCAFIMGFIVDIFSNTPGVASGAMTFTGMFQPVILSMVVDKDVPEDFVATYRSLGKWKHARYVSLVLLMHHLVYFSLESFSYFHWQNLAVSFLSSYVVSLVLVLSLETLRGRKK